MRFALPSVLFLLGGCTSDHCLELLTDGVQPSATTWIAAAAYRDEESRATLRFFQQGPRNPALHTAACTGPVGGESWRLLVWFDDSGQAPGETYCKDLLENPDTDCTPRPGQPFGETRFHFGSGINTVTVTIHPP